MQVQVYKSENKKIWDEFISNSKNGLFMFKRDFMDYHSDRFNDNSLLFYYKDKLLAVLPANIREDVLYSHQGLTFGGIISDNRMKTPVMLDIFESIRIYMQNRSLKKLVYKAIPYIYHQIPAQEDLYALSKIKASIFRTDVTSTVDLTKRPSFSSIRKRGAKKALKKGLIVEKSEDYAQYIKVLNDVLLENHNTQAVHSIEEIELLVSRFPDNIKLYTASKYGEIYAGTLIFEYPEVVHAQYIASSNKHRNSGSLDLVFSTLINETYQKKKYFDFGISTEDCGKMLNEGLIAQKEGFGARAVVQQFWEMNV